MWYNGMTSNQIVGSRDGDNIRLPEYSRIGDYTVPHSTSDASRVKICTKCKQSKPATTEYFRQRKAGKFGLHSRCKDCDRAWRLENRESIVQYMNDWHERNPGRKTNIDRVYRERNRQRLLQYSRAYYQANKLHWQEVNRRWYEKNKGRHQEKARAYRLANPDRIAALKRAWTLLHKDRVRKMKRDWMLANKEHCMEQSRIHVRRRIARKHNAEGDHTKDDVRRQYRSQKGKCYYCGIKVSDRYHVDHVIPLSRGGSNGPENLVIACAFCNESKGNKLPHEWPEGGRLL